jgi:hypothetical protein
MTISETELLRYALQAMQSQQQELDQQIQEVQRRLNGAVSAPSDSAESAPADAPKRARRKMSPEGRANIVAALKKRHALKKQASEKQVGAKLPKTKRAKAKQPTVKLSHG